MIKLNDLTMGARFKGSGTAGGRARAAWVVALLAVAGVLGCGGSSDSDGATVSETTTANSLTKPAFIKAADQICENADETQDGELNAYLKDTPQAQSSKAGEVKMIVVAGLPAVENEIEELRALGSPQGEEEQVEAIWAAMEKALEESERDPESLLSTSGNAFSQADKLAASYGFKACNKAL